jgi:hypothetical protein
MMMIKQRLISGISAVILAAAILATPTTGQAQSSGQEDNGVFVLGSVLLSIIHVPLKLVTCAGTQVSSAVFYTATYDVRGYYDGGTNGRDIGETARRSCTGEWIITPEQVKKFYGSCACILNA